MKLLLLPLAILIGFCILVVRNVVRKLRIIRAQLAAYRQGDYEAQLKIVEGLKIGRSERPDYLFFHGSACYHLGRLAEAEQALRRSLSKETNPLLKTICRDELGRVLMAQQRWDEAEGCFRQCIAEFPSRGGVHRSLAETLLERNGWTGAALEQARVAVLADRAERAAGGKAGDEANALNLGESLAVLAWALAENRADPSELQENLAEAFALCGERTKPILAKLHYWAGRAYAALGNPVESSRHFQQAAETDPAGHYGRLALPLTAAPSGT